MKITRLRVSELRQFRRPFELAGLEPGLNLFAGANEAGKSTLVRAIRAAFFERHRSTSVDDLRPYGDAAATPTIELDFEVDGTPYRLLKSFLHKKRCELVAGSRRLEGVEAEDFLAGLLGYQFASRGGSREEHWGIPGLLWIEQGAGQQVHDAVGHAADHLRSALEQSLGEVAASGGDQLRERVRTLRGELLTGTGRPRATYQQAIEDADKLQAQTSELAQAAAAYREQVDQLQRLRQAQAADAAEQPGRQLREQQAQAEAALRTIDGLAQQRDAEHDRLRRSAELHALLQQQQAAAEQQRQDLVRREATLAAARLQQAQAAAAEQQAIAADQTATQQLQAASSAWARARQAHERGLVQQQLDDARRFAGQAQERLAAAGAEHERGTTLQREAVALRIDESALATLRQQQQRLRELEIRQSAAATRLSFELDAGVELQLDGEPLAGTGERRLLAAATLQIPGVGRLQIAPGGSDLDALAREHQALVEQQRALLLRLGLDSLDGAEMRAIAHRQKVADAAAAAQALALVAPKGLDSLRGEFDSASARQTELTATLARWPADHGEPVPLARAEADHNARRLDAEASARRLTQAQQALNVATHGCEAALREHDALRAALTAPQRQAEEATRRQALSAGLGEEQALQAAVAALEARIAAARPELLRQDVERLRRSADAADNEQRTRERQIVQLEAALDAAGAQGLDEALASCQGALAQAQRRRDELQRRADALDLLLTRLDAGRQALTRRLQAPLQQHLDRYLELLIPGGRLLVEEDLAPGALSRPGRHGAEASPFDTLSFGAQEQMGVISRLAYADLLQAAGRPTLLILDDALVHSDEPRLAQMKRVLFDAAQRHQVLLFTCHPARWRDLGSPLRALEDERAAQA